MSSDLDKLNTFIERFRHDYTIGKIDIGKYGAYLKWKFEDSPLPSFYEVVDMSEKVSEDLEKYDIKYPGAASYTEPYLMMIHGKATRCMKMINISYHILAIWKMNCLIFR